MSVKHRVATKSIRLTRDESKSLKRISEAEGLSEAALMKRFVLEGVARYRLEQAVAAYTRGEADLSAAAHHAGISVYQMMTELKQREITPRTATEKFLNGLETLAETFGGSEELFQVIAEMRQAASEESVQGVEQSQP